MFLYSQKGSKLFKTKKSANIWKRCLNLFLTLPSIKVKSDLKICSNFVAFSGQNISLMEKHLVHCFWKWNENKNTKIKPPLIVLFHHFSLLVKTRLKPDFETSVSIDDVVSLDDSTSLENLSLSPTHYIEKAANVAVGLGSTYLPSSAQDRIAKGAFFQNLVWRPFFISWILEKIFF